MSLNIAGTLALTVPEDAPIRAVSEALVHMGRDDCWHCRHPFATLFTASW